HAVDEARQTHYICNAIIAATQHTTFAIGHDIHLVQRLADEHPQHEIFCLDPVVCPCSTMYRIHPGYLAWTLEELVAGRTPNRITVAQDVAEPARVALERMLAAKPPAAGAR
ncbi:MAG: quinolinate synthase NadA, partial [Microbacterium sp.]|nr:quinolinate synthase NadA [Microbacterium sp.]